MRRPPTTTLDPSAARPLYAQLAGTLRARVLSGELKPGDRVPTTAELVESTGVSAITVNQAIAALVREGLLSRRPRLGTFVTAHAPRTRTVAIVAPFEPRGSVGDSFIMQLFRGLEATFASAGCGVSVVPCASAAEFASAALLAREASGLALVGPADAALVRAVKRTGKPAVVLDTPGAHECGLDSVVVDNEGLTRAAVARLVAAGHRKILYYGIGAHDRDNDERRLDGYRAALRDAGIRVAAGLVLEPSSRAASKEIAAALRATGATALFLANAGYWESALRAAALVEAEVPRDLSLACFGRVQAVPTPAGVDLDAEQMGARAAARLVARLDDDSLAPEELVVTGSFVDGETIAPPRA